MMRRYTATQIFQWELDWEFTGEGFIGGRKTYEGKIKNQEKEDIYFFCSLYNRNAEVHIFS